ncbi:TIGR04211 family SH3 domain-containing protein [Crenothrix sp.]|uniref:TIGR04211 family SH3 domain-containing protein n=1 Tax=Crenothrix sp. TaxID=3100433 RepID=UPI00374D76F8
MKKILSTFFVLILICGVAQAKQHQRGHSKHKAAVADQAQTVNANGEAVKDPNAPVTPLEFSLTKDKELLNRELTELKKTSANAQQIKNERDSLQERVVNVERDLQQFKLENQALKDSANQDWFLYGGGLALAGVLLGFIIPKISWGRRNTWGSF